LMKVALNTIKQTTSVFILSPFVDDMYIVIYHTLSVIVCCHLPYIISDHMLSLTVYCNFSDTISDGMLLFTITNHVC
jgi:hypothetical protein